MSDKALINRLFQQALPFKPEWNYPIQQKAARLYIRMIVAAVLALEKTNTTRAGMGAFVAAYTCSIVEQRYLLLRYDHVLGPWGIKAFGHQNRSVAFCSHTNVEFKSDMSDFVEAGADAMSD